jgi:hypothetical protein
MSLISTQLALGESLRQATAGQRLSDVRKEAILTGFEEAYRAKRYEDITAVGAKLNQSLVDSSTEIFDFIDIAGAKLAKALTMTQASRRLYREQSFYKHSNNLLG